MCKAPAYVVLAILASGCSPSSPALSTPPPSTVASSPASTTSTASQPPPSGDAPDAKEGSDFDRLFDVKMRRADGLRDVVRGVTSDGAAVVSRVRDDLPDSQELYQDHLFIKRAGGETPIPVTLNGPGRQVAAAVTLDGHVVWVETSSTSLFEADWELFAGDTLGKARHLASSSRYGDPKAPPPPEHRPVSLDGDRAYVTTVFRRSDGSGFYTSIVSARLAGGEVTTLVSDAHLPTASARGLYFVRAAVVSRNMPSGTEIGFLPRGGDRPRVLQRLSLATGERIASMCTVGESLVWVIGNTEGQVGGRVQIRDVQGRIQTIKLSDNGQDTHVSCGDGIVAWGESSGMYVHSLTSSRTWKVGQVPGRNSIYASGKTVAWSLPQDHPRWPSSGYLVVHWRH